MGYQGKRTVGAGSPPSAGAVSAPARPDTKGKGKRVLILVILLLVAIIGALVWFFVLHPKVPGLGLEADPNVQIGTNSKSKAEREAELQRLVDEGYLTFMINYTPMFSLSKPEQGCNWLIENPEENHTRFTVTVVRNDTQEVIYQSGYLDPKQYIDTAPMDADKLPPKGVYNCTAYFNTYSLEENHEYVGTGGADIDLYIVD